MASLTRLTRIAGLGLALSCGLAAADGSPFAFKMLGGPMDGSARKSLGDAGYVFGADFEYARPMGGGSLVWSLGYRNYPGDNQILSFIPTTVTATTTNPTFFETRVRKAQGEGFQVGAVYRKDMWMDGMYVQGGLKLARTKVGDNDTGTRITTNGSPFTYNGTGALPAAILRVDAIAEKTEKTGTALVITAGVGYRLSEQYALELNLANTQLEGPHSGKKAAFTTELAFSIRF